MGRRVHFGHWRRTDQLRAGRICVSADGSAGSMALVTLLAFLPTLLLSVPAGVLADRHDRRLLMMVGDGCSAFGILYILLCMMNGEAALWQICVGVFISSTFSALLEPSYRATVTDLLTSEEYSKASGMVSIAGSARYLISPYPGRRAAGGQRH